MGKEIFLFVAFVCIVLYKSSRLLCQAPNLFFQIFVNALVTNDCLYLKVLLIRAGPRNKKSSPDESDELLNMMMNIFEAIDLTYLSRQNIWMELAPFSSCEEEVVKASSGHNPPPFLISEPA